MRKSERSPYARLATDADRQAWLGVFAPSALVGFVQITVSDMTHWAAVVRSPGIRKKHGLYCLCSFHILGKPTPGVEVGCMTCMVRIERGLRGF